MQNVLVSITEGMKVFDSANHEIGKVDYVKLVETDPASGQPLAADIDVIDDDRDNSLIEDLAEAFAGDELPEAVQKKLLHNGFVRMDADGLFASDRYVLPEQISAVSGDRVTLNVSKDQLQKMH